MAVGHWDHSLSQAIAAEVAKNKNWAYAPETESHDRPKRHGQPLSEQQRQQGMHGLRIACSTMDTLEKVALTRLLLQHGGEDALHSHLADPRVCGVCFGLQQQLVTCPRSGCRRRLCPECFTKEDKGTNHHICDQTHPDTWRAAIRLLDQKTQIVAQWQKAAKDVDLLTEQLYGRPRQAV